MEVSVTLKCFVKRYSRCNDFEIAHKNNQFSTQELAGRTMDFTFDVSQTPLIGRRILLKSDSSSNQNLNRGGQTIYLSHHGTPNSPRRSASLSPADAATLSGWKRPWMSQGRVRECLVNLLTTCGQRVGLPKSPSVSFSIFVFFVTLLN